MINLLVCRIKRGHEVNKSAKMLLDMIRPKLKALAKIAVSGTGIAIETALADLESQTIEYIQTRFILGEVTYPLHFLFGTPNGWMYRFANNYAKKTRRWEDTHTLFDNRPGRWKERGEEARNKNAFYLGVIDEQAIEAWEEAQAEQETEETSTARKIIDDGLTLSSQEYLIVQFCLENATEARRPLNGLHVYLAKLTGMPRAKVTKIAKDAFEKVKAEV